jgi:transcriptional regulator with XRE-family HTH domain
MASLKLLDHHRVRQLRLERGLSERELARRLNVTSAVISTIEAGENHEELMLRVVHRLAGALEVDIATLLSKPRPSTPPAALDDARLEAALFLTARQTRPETVARALGWSLKRTAAAADALAERLSERGLRLSHAGGLALRVDESLLTSRERQALATRMVGQSGLKKSQARLLAHLLAGKLTSEWLRTATNPNRVTLAELVNLGWAEPHNGGYRATRAVRRSLKPAEDAIAAVDLDIQALHPVRHPRPPHATQGLLSIVDAPRASHG